MQEQALKLTREQVRVLQRALLSWYAANRRDLPWRCVTDPYPVWISEVMLQQTQVQTVIPYYLRFLKRFPNIRSLANAEINDLLRLWAGLGYYSRARNLQRAAKVIVERFAGKFPQDYTHVLSLPGVGRYTAAAILSIAFAQHYAVVDGNVARVLARLFAIRGDPKNSPVLRHLWEVAQRLLPKRQPGDFNQAIMELGATVCSPRNPQCGACPWEQRCIAFALGVQEQLPEKGEGAQSKKIRRAAVVIRHRGRYFLTQRTGEKLLEDFWEFPAVEFHQSVNPNERLAEFVAEQYGLKIKDLEWLVTVKHSITSQRIVMEVFEARFAGRSRRIGNGKKHRWVPASETDRYPFASASRQILDRLKAER